MTTLREGEIEFVFGAAWRAETGGQGPIGGARNSRAAAGVRAEILSNVVDRSSGVIDMQTKTLVYEKLAPKARSSYGFLHLMARDTKPMRFVVVIGVENLSIQPPLIEQLADRLRRRVKTEASEPWKREYVAACTVVPPPDLGKALPGCSARRIPGAALSRGKDL